VLELQPLEEYGSIQRLARVLHSAANTHVTARLALNYKGLE